MTTPPVEGVDGARQVKNSVIYLVPTVVAAAAVFVTLPLFTRVLTVEDFGALALATAYATFASGLANFGLVVSYERNFFQFTAESQRAALLYSTVAFVLATHAALGVVTWVARDWISQLLTHEPAYGALMFWSFCASGFAAVKAYYLVYLRNTHDAWGYVRYTVDEHVLGVMFSLVFVLALEWGALGVVAGQLLASVIVLGLVVRQFVRRLPVAFSGALLGESLRLSYPLTPRLLMGVVGNQLDKYMLGRFGTVGAVGIYSIAQKFAFPVFTLTTALGNVFVPHVYQRMFARAAGGEETVGRYLTPYLYASFGAALGVALFAEELVRLLTAPAYHGSAVLVTILAMYYAVLFFGKLPQLMFAKKTFLISVLSMVSMAANALFVAVGIHWAGASGAAWGTLASGVLLIGLSQVLGHRYYPIKYEYGALVTIVGVFIGASLLVIGLTGAGVSHTTVLSVKAALVGLYLAVGMWVGVLGPQTLTLARQVVPGFRRRST